MTVLRIVMATVVAAVAYGILHDMITAHVCVEYFTVAHPFIIPSQDPVVMALLWGVLATWWVGLILGVGLAAAARCGAAPKLEPQALCMPVLRLLGTTVVCAMLVGLIGYVCARSGWIWLLPPLSDKIPAAAHPRFFFDAFAHTASYALGFLGGSRVIYRTWKSRKA